MGDLMEQSQRISTNWENVREISQVSSRKEFHEGQETHVWKIALNKDLYWNNELSPEEQRKAARFRFPHDQNRYIVSHSVLRLILSTYMNSNPSTLRFDQTKYGKPSLKGGKALKFNMTYSKDVVCYIVSMRHEVGIDIEHVKPNFDWLNIARLYFTTKEADYLKGLPRDDQAQEFFYLWTQREALLKAEGIGLSGIERINTNEFDDIKRRYLLATFNCGGNYQGAIATGREVSSVRFFTLPVD